MVTFYDTEIKVSDKESDTPPNRELVSSAPPPAVLSLVLVLTCVRGSSRLGLTGFASFVSAVCGGKMLRVRSAVFRSWRG